MTLEQLAEKHNAHMEYLRQMEQQHIDERQNLQDEIDSLTGSLDALESRLDALESD